MQNFFQEFISFLLNSWKSLIFLFVFSFAIKETIGRVFINILRAITHLIIDLSDKTVSPFYSNDWESELSYWNYAREQIRVYTYDIIDESIRNEKIKGKYFRLINLYNSFFKSSFLFSILTYSKLAPKLNKKTRKKFNYILSSEYGDVFKEIKNIEEYKNQFKQIAYLLIHKIRFLLLKIYVYSKTIYVFNEKTLIPNFKKSIKKNEKNDIDNQFNYNLNIRNLPPIKDLELLLDLQLYCDCVQGEHSWGVGMFNLSSFWDYNLTGVGEAQELVDKFKNSNFLKGITFDVFFNDMYLEKSNAKYQVLKSPNFSNDNYWRYRDLVKKDMMISVEPLDIYGDEYLCPDYRVLQYKYCFITNIQIDEVIQFIEKLDGQVTIYVSQGNLEERLKRKLISKSITNEKNYYYVSRLEQLKLKIDNVFKYIDYTFILFYFAFSIFVEQNYFSYLEASITSLLESLKSYL